MMSILSAAEASSKQSGSSSVEFEVFACRSNYDPRFGIENSAAAMSKFQRASIEHALVTSPFGKIFRMIAVLEILYQPVDRAEASLQHYFLDLLLCYLA